MNKIYARMKSFALKIMGLFGYKPNHPTTLDEMLYEESFEDKPTNDYVFAAFPKQRARRGEKAAVKNALLNDLDKYFNLLKKMKKADHTAYEFYKKIGGQIVTDFQFDADELNTLPPRWKKDRPAFGCVLCTNDIDKKEKKGVKYNKYTPQMLYFTRYDKPPSGVQMVPAGYDVYKVTVHWYEQKKFNVTTDICVGIDPENNVHMLFTKVDDTAVFYSKRVGARGKCRQVVHRQKWGIHEFYKDWADDHKITPEELLVNLFCYTINIFDASNMSGMIEVRAHKNNLVGRFMLQPQDAAYMFKDRERLGNTRKHIFHSVVPHTRTIKGKEKNIKLHFRGQRDFYWNGYNINIVVPIRETMLYLPEIDFKAFDGDDPDNKHLLKDSVDGGAELADFLLKVDRGEYKRARAH